MVPNPIKMDDLGVKTPIFGNSHIYMPPLAVPLNSGTACSVRWPINSVVMQRNIKVIAKGVAHTCWTMQRLVGYWLDVPENVRINGDRIANGL